MTTTLMTTVTTSRNRDDPRYPAIFDLIKTDVDTLLPPEEAAPVIAILEDRNQYGQKKYGVPLRPFDGNDPLREAYQEYVDFVVYLRQAIYEMDSPMSDLLVSIYPSALRELSTLGRLVAFRGYLEEATE